MIEIKEFFSDDVEWIKDFALSQRYVDLKAYDGETYKRVAIVTIPGLQEGLEKQMGPVLMLGQGFRLNYGNEEPNNAIHVDVGWGTHAVVVYLSNHPDRSMRTGTAFFSDTDRDSEMVDFCQEEFNKAVIYRSDQPHSRWPLKAYGDSPANGRLIAVGFFTPLSELR